MTEAAVLTSVDNRGVARVSLNRPEVNNAYNGEMIDALVQALEALAVNDDVRVVVIQGEGRHFQAGADLDWIDAVRQQDLNENVRVSRTTAMALVALNQYPKPTLALVHGGCFGGGIGLIASCDIVLAEHSARFAISEARWGLIASIILPQLNAAMGLRQVRRYALSCEQFDAARAQEMGLVHELCEPGQLNNCAAEVIEHLLKSAPEAIGLTKKYALRVAGLEPGSADIESLIQSHAEKRRSNESLEGLASFREKRNPNWYPSS